MNKYLPLILIILFLNITILVTVVNSQQPKSVIVNISCKGTGNYNSGNSYNWFDDYKFFSIPELKGKVFSYYMGGKLENCSHCMGRTGMYVELDNSASTLTIGYDTIKLKEFGNPTVNTTISRSSGNFSSIDTVQNGQTTINRSGSCTNINLLYSKIDELKNLKGSKSSGSPDKGTDSGAKDTLKKILGK